MNKNEDQIISGSMDLTLKIWRNVSGIWKETQRLDTRNWVTSISLNEAEDKLITCQNEYQSSLQILVLQDDQKWYIVQTLDFQDHVQRLCFTIGDQCLIQNQTSNCLEIYDYDSNLKYFQPRSKVQMQQVQYCNELFPCQFIKSLSILTFKYGRFLNIFKVHVNYNYELIQTIQYLDHSLYGRITEDKQYRVTWNDSSKEIQIRKISYLE